jgi:hypothetical protein
MQAAKDLIGADNAARRIPAKYSESSARESPVRCRFVIAFILPNQRRRPLGGLKHKPGFAVMENMKILTLGSLFLIVFSLTAMAQSTTPPTPDAVKEANPADVASIDSIMKAVYDVISGDAGQKRDWDRFRSLFHKDAKLIPSGKNQQTGVQGARFLSPEDYIAAQRPDAGNERLSRTRTRSSRRPIRKHRSGLFDLLVVPQER